MTLFGHGLGCLPDPRDSRDLGIGELLRSTKAAPLTGSVRHPLVNPRSQGSTSSCVGFAWAQAVRLAYLAKGASCPDLSPLFAYYLARATHQAVPNDNGTNLRSVAKATQALGLASEPSWPFSLLRVNRSPNMRAHHDGHMRRGIRGYCRIASGDLDGIRRAIAAGYPVVFGVRIDRAFTRNSGPTVVESLGDGGLGGHAMVIEDFDEMTFGVLNSWGTDWRDRGRCRFTEGLMARAVDVWAVDVRAT